MRPRARRGALGVLALGATLPLLAGCFGGAPAAPADESVGSIEDVKTATMLFEGQGTFIEPWTLDPAEVAWVGTGWFISPDGYAVTNNHVVTGAGTLKVSIGGEGTTYPAQVVSASECYDLAVVKVDVDEPVPYLAWFDGEITEGLEIYSAGYPLALGAQYTLTKGIVSQADTAMATPWADIAHAIQHDARIRGGNSGGPLVNPEGKVLGVNYAGNDSTDENIAISRADAQETVEQLKNGETVLSLGLNAQANPPREDGSPDGIWVASVKPGSPADKAGIKPGDVIDRLNGVTMSDDGTLKSYCDVLRTNGTDATMTVEVYRPATQETLEGQINGTPLEVVSGGGGNGGNGGGGQAVGAFVDISNDEGNMTMTVPDTWDDVNGTSTTEGWFMLEASPDLEAYGGTFDVPGVSMTAVPGEQDPASVLASYNQQLQQMCSPSEENVEYADGFYTGLYSYYTNCGGGSTEFAVITANSDSGGGFVILTIQMVSEFDKTEVLDQVLGSFYAEVA